jgi:hypothetical protein
VSTLRIFNNPRDGYVLVAEQGRIGRLSGEAVTICGFASEADAVTAASVAFHGLRAHLAERTREQPERSDIPGDSTAVTVHREEGSEAGSFCFELRFPARLTELEAVRAARTIHAALRRWADRGGRNAEDN